MNWHKALLSLFVFALGNVFAVTISFRETACWVPNYSGTTMIAVSGTTAYVWGTSSFTIYDVIDPTSPKVVSTTRSAPAWGTTFCAGTNRFAFSPAEGYYDTGYISISDISTPQNPRSVDSIPVSGFKNMRSWNGKLFFVSSLGLGLWDRVGHFFQVIDQWAGINWIDIEGNFLYAETQTSLSIFEIQPDASLLGIGTFVGQPGDHNARVNVVGTKAFIYVGYSVDSHSLKTIDVSNPSNPVEIARLNNAPNYLTAIIGRSGTRLFTESGEVLEGSQPNLPVIGSLPNLPAASYGAIQGNYLYTIGDGFGILDISDLSNPKILSKLTTGGNLVDFGISGNLGLVAAGSAGLEILDLGHMTRVGNFRNAPYSTATYVQSQGSIAFLSGAPDSLIAVDIQDPAKPFARSRLSIPNAGAISLDGGLAVVGTLEPTTYRSGFALVDCSNPDALRLLSITGTNLTFAILHNGFVYACDYNMRLRVFDISDPQSSQEIWNWLGVSQRGVSGIEFAGNTGWIVGQGGIGAVDFANPHAPRVLSPLQAANCDSLQPFGRFGILNLRFVADLGVKDYPRLLQGDLGFWLSSWWKTSGQFVYTLSADAKGIAAGAFDIQSAVHVLPLDTGVYPPGASVRISWTSSAVGAPGWAWRLINPDGTSVSVAATPVYDGGGHWHTWIVLPEGLTEGSGYGLRVRDEVSSGESGYTESFAISSAPGLSALLQSGTVVLRWSQAFVGFRLIGAANPQGPWSDVGATINSRDGIFETTVTSDSAARFFRLTK